LGKPKNSHRESQRTPIRKAKELPLGKPKNSHQESQRTPIGKAKELPSGKPKTFAIAPVSAGGMCSVSVKHLQLLTSYCHHHKCALFLCNFQASSPAGASAVSTDASIQSFAERNTRDIAFVAVEHGLGRAWERTPKDFASHVEDGLMRTKKAPDSDRSI